MSCLAQVKKVLGRELTPEEAKSLQEDVSGIIERIRAENIGDDLEAAFNRAISERTDEIRMAALIEKRNAALNAQARVNTYDFVANHFADQPGEGLFATIGGSLVNRHGSKDSINVRMESLYGEYASGTMSRLQRAGVFDVVKSEKLDRQTYKAMSLLNEDKVDLKALKNLPEEAVEVARVYNDYGELARVNANKAGAHIGKLSGYATRRTHSPDRLAKAGGRGIRIGDPRHFNAWFGFLEDKLDWGRTFPDVPPSRRREVMQGVYHGLVEGVHLKYSGAPPTGLKGYANIGKQLSHERVLHFKDADLEFDYNHKFGSGRSLAEDVMGGLKAMARDTAIMQKLGPNAKSNLDQVKAMLMAKYRGNHEALKGIKKRGHFIDKYLWPSMTGELSIPANNMLASASAFARALNNMGMLGSATISALSDLAFRASGFSYATDRSFGSFAKGLQEAAGDTIGSIGKRLTPEQMQAASEMGIVLDAVLGPMSKFDMSDGMPGFSSLMNDITFRLNGLQWYSDRTRLGAALSLGNNHFFHKGKKWADLPQGTRDYMSQFGIGDGDWNLIRATKAFDIGDGRAVLTPEAILDISDDMVSAHLKSIGKSGTKSQITRYRDTLKGKYQNVFRNFGADSTTEPMAVERAIMQAGTQAGTGLGEIVRLGGQFKMFTATVMRKHLGRELFGYHAEKVTIPEAMARMFNDPRGGLTGASHMIATSTLLGGGAVILKGMSRGVMPTEMDDPDKIRKFIYASLLQGGGAGIYGDFLFAQNNRFGGGVISTLAGPTAGRAEDAHRLFLNMRDGDMSAARTLNFAVQNTPGVNMASNLFYTRAAMDYLILHRLKEYLNPGYLKRTEQRMKKDGKRFIVPPSEVIPHGGF